MGVDLLLIRDNQKVADLGRAYHYDIENPKETMWDIIGDVKLYIGVPLNKEDLEDVALRLADGIEDVFSAGKCQLLEELKEYGFETMTDIEWEERQKIKEMPDYFEPKFKSEE